MSVFSNCNTPFTTGTNNVFSNQPITRSMTTGNSFSNINRGIFTTSSISTPSSLSTQSITSGVASPTVSTAAIIGNQYCNYIYNNIKDFKTRTNMSNSQIEKIWEHNFNKKNKGYCQNCNMYPISKPINFRTSSGNKAIPTAIIVDMDISSTTINDKYCFVCYFCFNEHLQTPTSICDATAPMDTREDGDDKVPDNYFEYFKKYNKR